MFFEGVDLAKFLLRDITLHIPDRFMNEFMVNSLKSGRYESSESFAVEHHLTADDRVLELGGGAGYLSIQISKIVGPENLMTVEANLKMIDVIARNLKDNGVEGANIIHAAAVSDTYTEEYVTFHVTPAFWGASLLESRATQSKMSQSVSVPAVQITELVEDFKPTLVMMDIEGAEAEMFEGDWAKSVRMIIMEIHPRVYENSRIKHIFDRLSLAGLVYCPVGSRGNVIVFERVRG